MPNMNVKQRLDRLSAEIDSVVKHVVQYSGIDKKDAVFIDNVATGLALQAARLAGIAQAVLGVRGAASTEKRVRKALGFTHP